MALACVCLFSCLMSTSVAAKDPEPIATLKINSAKIDTQDASKLIIELHNITNMQIFNVALGINTINGHGSIIDSKAIIIKNIDSYGIVAISISLDRNSTSKAKKLCVLVQGDKSCIDV
jgi:hypothetical protein